MTPILYFLIFVGLGVAPGFVITLCGLLIHHGIWSVEWAVPTLFFGTTLRYFIYETTWGGRKRSFVRPFLLLPYTVLLLLVGLYATHFVHVVLSPLTRLSLAVLAIAVSFVWLARLGPRLPPQLARFFRRLPDPDRLPSGARRLLAAFLVIPFLRAYPGELEAALGEACSKRGLQPELSSLQVSGERPRGLRAILGARRVLFLARKPGSPTDVYLARVMFDHEGRTSHVTGLFNLSDTASVDEDELELDGRWAAWKIRSGGRARSIELVDLGGEKVPSGPGWSLLGRLQRRITNVQHTGQFRGVGRRSVPLTDSWTNVATELDHGNLVLQLGSEHFLWELGREPGQEFVDAGLSVRELPPARPGNLTTWAVDRLRQVSFIGSDGMQWLKGVAFVALGEMEDLHARVVGVNAEETISEELGEVVERLPIARTSGIPHWPPAPLKSQISPVLPSEGEWVDLGRDVVSGGDQAGDGAMLFTFIRVDPKRTYNQVSITLWDPRRVELHIVAGTEEPQSTIGQQGTGLIPRSPETLKNLLGAFNGAFQAVHGEFGMMEAKVVQLPPKPFAASVATFDDGSSGFGTWPAEAIKIPADMVGLRQNMTPLVAESRPNPYSRHWWGGVPEGWTQEARTVRSGLCLTKDKYIAYLYSPSIDPDRLASAMLLASCTYGIHLDMNAGHAGFELYRVEPTGSLPSLGRALDSTWEATGKVPHAEGFSFLARLMVKKMPLMNFPRYINETPRDFFYLTRRSVLPGPAVPASSLAGLKGQEVEAFAPLATSNNEFPYFVVRTTLPVGVVSNGEVTVDRLDPKELSVEGAPQDRTFSFALPKAAPDQASGAAGEKHRTLQFGQGKFAIQSGLKPAWIALVEESLIARGADLYCIDQVGFLNIVELSGEPNEESLGALSQGLGCVQSMLASSKQRLRFAPEAAEGRAFVYRSRVPKVRQIFPETPLVSPTVWGIPQAKRVNYVP